MQFAGLHHEGYAPRITPNVPGLCEVGGYVNFLCNITG
jgi:hypothetical protein